jgi:hypothetical protein
MVLASDATQPFHNVEEERYRLAVRLYAGAFSADGGRCFRLVYEEATTRPMHCPGEVVTRGWFRDRRGVWWVVDACAEHADSLSGARPGPGSRIGRPGPLPTTGRRGGSGPLRAAA